jgi:predicted ATPase/DNA-binding CsgD family transcriptional regulator
MSSRTLAKSSLNLRLLETSTEPVFLPAGWIEVPNTQLVGRAREIADIATLVQEPDAQLVTLTGPGGVGKTRLALAAAHTARNAFADGVVFVPLARIINDSLVCVAIARALDLRVMGDEPALNRISHHLADKRLLLVLDNFEHVVEASARLAHLLHDSPGVTALVTSRIHLRVSMEREYAVAPLPLPTGNSDPTGSPAVQLFLQRMPARTREAPTTETVAVSAQIVNLLDGLPLAIELAAARTAVLPPAALLERLEQRLPLLTGGARDLPPRQQTMRDTIAWSYDLLGPHAQQFFRALSVFRGGFSLPAAERLGSAIGFVDQVSVSDALTSLVEHSLVQPVPDSAGQPRYTMFETVREFGWERLQALNEGAQLEAAQAAITLAGAEAAAPELYGAAQGIWLDALELDQPNLRTALSWAVEHDPGTALRLCGALLRFWPIRGYLGEGRTWLERALAASSLQPDPVAETAGGLVALAWIHYWQGDFIAGARLASDALGRFQALESRQGQADALRVLGHLLVGQAWQQEPPDMALLDKAEAAFSAQLAIWQDLQHSVGAAMALQNLGFVALNQGRTVQGGQLLEESITHFATLGDRWSLALSLTYLANLDIDSNVPRAAQRLAQALAIYAELRDQWKVAATLDAAALWLQRNHRPAEAAYLVAAASGVLERCGVVHIRAHTAGAARPLPADALYAAGSPASRDRPITLEGAISQAQQWLAAFSGHAAVRADPEAPLLTERERDVLRLLVQGLSDRRIADILQISPRTVGGHVTRLLNKLGVDSRTAAATYAVRHGLA